MNLNASWILLYMFNLGILMQLDSILAILLSVKILSPIRTIIQV